MFYYEIAPGDRGYHGNETLTYHLDSKLSVGQIVVVKLRTKNITGFVVRNVPKPAFTTKPIDRIVEEARLSPELCELFSWLREFYPAPLGSISSLFIPPALAVTKLKPSINSEVELHNPPKDTLTNDQQTVIKDIEASSQKTFILHGDTGTGKTRIYIELARKSLESGKSVLILTPEIGLTPQLMQTLSQHFSNIQVTHSELPETKRREMWRLLAISDTPQLLIGPRSALFMPLKNIGLIIIDEFHDDAYKQEQTPRYHALRVAAKLREFHGARLVMGSATPSISDYFYATSKNVPVLRMQEKPSHGATHKVKKIIVDLTDKNEQTKYELVSKTLVGQLKTCLDNGEQALLFLNKRGSARMIVCKKCGWFASCPRCDLPYTYHHDTHQLTCHTCGNKRAAPNACEQCGAVDIIFRGPGTKAIEQTIRSIFPEANVARFDKDNKASETFSARHTDVQTGSIDILIGTQLLSKGHDLPRLSLVGILLADGGLQFPDFSSEERSYQLLHQLAGRVGRGHLAGTVVAQTYNPDLPILKALDHKHNSWSKFYEQQLAERKSFGFPPFYHALKVETSRKQSATAEKIITAFARNLQKQPNLVVIGPSPSFIAKRGNAYYWQLVIMSRHRQALTAIIPTLPPRVSYDLDPVTML